MTFLKALCFAFCLAFVGWAVNMFSVGAEWNLSPLIIPAAIGLTVLCWIGMELSELNAYFRKKAKYEVTSVAS